MPDDPTPDPQYSIGPYYQLLGGLLMLGGAGIAGLKVYRGLALGWADIALLGALSFAGLALLRPKVFEQAFKSFVAGLPWTKYTGGN